MPNIEKRKLDYILTLAHKKMDEIDDHFKKIDDSMKNLKVGDTIYDYNAYLDCFPKKITKIIDKEYGIIETYEESTKQTEIACVTNYKIETN